MFIYAGIDEAGYGPLLGPLLVSRFTFAIPALPSDSRTPQLWQRLSKAVCRDLASRKGRIAVNDSKKLTTAAAGIRHLELGCLAFAAVAGHSPTRLDHWLQCLGETTHHQLEHLPWYAPHPDRPWQSLPTAVTEGELTIARGMLERTCQRIGVEIADLGAAVVFEDRFNHMVRATRSKAATSFTFVATHLRHIWDRFGEHHPLAVVDRQGGRTHYRELLDHAFPEAAMTVLEESDTRSAYYLHHPANGVSDSASSSALHSQPRRAITISFETEADATHMPVALASMISKYTRELMMHRFNAFFQRHLPQIAPTAGYARDGQRFCNELRPHLPALGINEAHLRRLA